MLYVIRYNISSNCFSVLEGRKDMRLIILLFLLIQILQINTTPTFTEQSKISEFFTEKRIITAAKTSGSLCLLFGICLALWGMNERRMGNFAQRMQNLTNKHHDQENPGQDVVVCTGDECRQKIELGQKETDWGVITAAFGLFLLGIREVCSAR